MIEQWFSTPIYFYHNEDDTVLEEIKKCISQVKLDTNPTWAEGLHTTFNNQGNDIIFYELYRLKDLIENHTTIYAKECGYDYKPVISSSWFNFNEHNHFQFSHNHIGDKNVISGIYYVETTGSDGDTVFENPNQFINAETFPCNKSFETVSYQPEINKLLLFPSWLKHRVNPNLNNSTRITISFNIQWSEMYE